MLKVSLCLIFASVAYARPDVNDNEIGGAFSLLENRTFLESIRSVTYDDCQVSLEDWEAPFNLSRKFGFYLSGFDDDGRPIWIVEAGKMDLRSEVEAGEDRVKAIELYARQACNRIFKYAKKSEEFPGGEGLVIVDAEGLDITQIYSPRTVIFGLRMALAYRQLFIDHCGLVVAINANYFAHLIARIARQMFGGVFDRVEIYGNNKERWIPELLKKFPKDQLPPWYGGSKDFKPVQVFG